LQDKLGSKLLKAGQIGPAKDSAKLELDSLISKPKPKDEVPRSDAEIRMEIVQQLRTDLERLLENNTVDKASMMTGRY
jgi:hypothetical protein